MLKNLFTKILFSLAMLSLLSCDKDDESKATSCHLASQEISFGDNSFIMAFAYENGKITRIDHVEDYEGTKNEYTSEVEYDSHGNIIEFGGFDEESYIYTYNTSHQVIKVEEYEGGEIDELTEYEYQDSRVVKRQFYIADGNGNFLKNGYEVYEYPNSTTLNPSMTKSYSEAGQLRTTVAYEYDNKKTPYSLDPALYKLIQLSQSNNVTKETYTYVGDEPEVTTYTYEYNSDGYPTNVVESYMIDGSERSRNFTYTYACN